MNINTHNILPTIVKLDPKKELPIMGIKIIEEQYATDFIENGKIHFSNPKTWRDPQKCSGKQFDRDEGCFCFSANKNDTFFSESGRLFKKECSKEGWKYFEDTDMIVGTCFYGILRSDFCNETVQYGVKKIIAKHTKVGINYFNEFNDNKPDNKAILIFDFWRFVDLIISRIVEMGVLREEIFFSTVYYVDKKVHYCIREAFPFEYFLKDKDYKEQAEFRIIVSSKNNDFYRELQRNNNNDVGVITKLF